MKVSDVMSKYVDYVTTDKSVKDVCRLIFGAGINGVPVCRNKKVVGFVTERDILSKFYPSVQEYVDDPFSSSDFEGMETKVNEIFEMSADQIMSQNPITVTAQTPLLRAQSLMFIEKIGRLPVVDNKGNLVGIISKGDIFRAVVGDKLPITVDEEYHDWLSKHYDLMVRWGERLGQEVPDLTALFKKEKTENVVDIGCGTGEHDISLAKNGFNVLGLERSALMYASAKHKLNKLPKSIGQKLEFLKGNYVQILQESKGNLEAAIFMGNAFSHLSDNYKEVLSALSKKLSKEKGVVVFQIVNFEKVFKVKNRFLDLNLGKSKLGIFQEHAFLEFYDPPRKKGDNLTLNLAILDFNGKKWKHRAINSTPIIHLDREKIEKLLKKNGFKKVSFYGGQFLGPLFKDFFDPLKSDWLNVVAKR